MVFRNSMPWVVATCVIGLAVAACRASTGAALDSIRLTDVHGGEHGVFDRGDARIVVVAFLGVECPLAKLYGPRLARLDEEYADRDVAFYGINSNSQDTLVEIAAYGRRHKIGFPLLRDDRAAMADALGATRTPEVVVIDRAGVVLYRGRIDDQYAVGTVRDAPNREFLREALDEALAGRPIATPETSAVGCVIGRPREPDPSSDVTYSGQVARVLEAHCVECHREGEIAPFALRGYDDVAGWSETIAEVVRDGRMPPWHANPAHGGFANARLMTDEEKQILYDWAEAGAPEGDPGLLPEQREFVSGWRLPREPDLVIPMRDMPYRVAAEGVIDYQYFAVDPEFEEDRWIEAADIVPGARSVVHHVIVFVSPPADRARQGLGWLTAYVPGQSSMSLPAGRARLVPAGSKLIFQMHYTPSGAVEEDMTRLGICFAEPDSVEERVVSLVSANAKFEIPPGADDYEVRSTLRGFPPGAKLIGIAPHAHFRGKSFRFTGVWPDGRREVLLDVPRYDFNWQTNYRLKAPLTPSPGFRVECEGRYDNSDANPSNPDPTVAVRWGDQSFEEMMVSFFEVAAPRDSFSQKRPERGASDAQQRRADEIAEAFFDRHDANGDGSIVRKELPDVMAIFAFRRYDHDGNDRLTRDEVRRSALADLTRRF